MAKARRSETSKYKQEEKYKPRNKKEEFLMKVLAHIKNEKDMATLIRDLMTLAEIEEFANRLEMAKLLVKGESYQSIADKIRVSTTTVTRVAHWLYSGCGGYQKVLKK